ncbi:hypothetical protein F4778DRAFT_779849 [Xylariomycetidae sp. FL2044]|nr:hypothetical protein F4778DRAFT_779849 [Xylariomycetidae sp. FL2044]
MGATVSVVKTLIVPAVISLLLFLVSTYIIFPLWQRYRNRYSQYLPLESLSNRTTSLRARVQDAVARWLLPSRWRMPTSDRIVVGGTEGSEMDYSSEEGEELDEVFDDDDDDERRRHALSFESHGANDDSSRRLSRDLEEGFRDDSEEENDTHHRRH